MENEKKKYETPEMEIIEISTEEVLLTSTNDPNGLFGKDADIWQW